MCRTISTLGMSREEWLRERKKGIGGSDAGAICGVNPYSSPMNVYFDKTTDEISDEDNEAMRVGRDLEQYVSQRFMEKTGLKVRRSNKMYWSSQYPFMFADVDRLIVGEEAGLECKTVNAYLADRWRDGNVPAHYMLQCYHYMAVTGRRSWYLAALIMGVGFLYVKLVWDDAIIGELIRIEKNFWENYVVPRIIPSPDGSKDCMELLDKHYSVSQKGSSIVLKGFDEKLERRMELQKQLEQMQKEQNQIDQEIKLYMKDCEYAYSNHYRVSWSNVETTRVDAKRLKEEKPDIYEVFSKKISSRRFMIKAA